MDFCLFTFLANAAPFQCLCHCVAAKVKLGSTFSTASALGIMFLGCQSVHPSVHTYVPPVPPFVPFS